MITSSYILLNVLINPGKLYSNCFNNDTTIIILSCQDQTVVLKYGELETHLHLRDSTVVPIKNEFIIINNGEIDMNMLLYLQKY